nr:unnamed protein product [Spirometra erinaceieuropaei]
MQDAWTAHKAEEIQGCAERFEWENFFSAIKAVYGTPTEATASLLKADGSTLPTKKTVMSRALQKRPIESSNREKSILPKLDELKIHICDLSPDIVSLTETWLSENVDDRELMLPGFQLFRRDRRERQGGGVVTYVKHGLLVSEKTEQFACSAETIWLNIRVPGSHSLEVLTVYRPPRSDPEADARLLEELGRFALRPDVLIMGDFNAPLIDWSSLYARGPELAFDRRFLDMALSESPFTPPDYDFDEGPKIESVSFDEATVRKELMTLNESKSSGPDDIPPKLPKELAAELTKPLSMLFQASFEAGGLPADWKSARITPLHKGGSKASANNYRPISLTSIC